MYGACLSGACYIPLETVAHVFNFQFVPDQSGKVLQAWYYGFFAIVVNAISDAPEEDVVQVIRGFLF